MGRVGGLRRFRLGGWLVAVGGVFLHRHTGCGGFLCAEPLVTVIWSESADLRDGEQMPLSQADAVFKALDDAMKNEPGYDKTKFRIDFTMNGKADNYEASCAISASTCFLYSCKSTSKSARRGGSGKGISPRLSMGRHSRTAQTFGCTSGNPAGF